MRRSVLVTLIIFGLLSSFFTIQNVFAGEEPQFKVHFNFGTIGVNVKVFDDETGEKIENDKIEITGLPEDAESTKEIEGFEVVVSGYYPKIVKKFATFTISIGFLTITVFDLGEVYLDPKEPPKLFINSNPSGAEIYIDGVFRGVTPKDDIRLETGAHQIRLSKKGYKDWTRRTYVETGEKKKITADEAVLKSKNRPPSVEFTYSPTNPMASDVITFRDQSNDRDGQIVKWYWDLGDGTTSWGKTVTHTYHQAGSYGITLTVTDEDGASNSLTREVTVSEANEPPNPNFTYRPNNPSDLIEIQFTDQSQDPDGSITSWRWNFGDQSASTKQNPTHQYQDNGAYSVSLTVTDDKGVTNTITKEITVENVSPSAKFAFSPATPKVHGSVIFDASSSSDPDGEIEKYQWDFDGDGTVDKKGTKVEHTYTIKGEYRVKLTIIDDDGDSDSLVKKAQVTFDSLKVEDRYGIVIGISDYQNADEDTCSGPDHFCDLKYSHNDAKEFYNLLINKEIGEFPEDQVTLLINEEATASAIKSAFGKLITLAEENDLVVIYYSGHGGQGPDLNQDEGDGSDEYFLPYDVKLGDLFGTAIRDDEFGDWLSSLKSKNIVIMLDSCFSGGATKMIKGVTQSGYKATPSTSVFNDFSLGEIALLSASQENEYSYEYDELSHGVFTYYLLTGLKGKSDLNKDGKIIADELYKYVQPKVKEFVAEHGGKQTPLMKGAKANLPVIPHTSKQVGKVTAIVGNKDKAVLGDKVMISLGKNQGVKVGDVFEVFHEYQTKAVEIEEVRGRIKVIELVGQERALCEVTESIVPVEVEDRVRKTRGK